MGVLVPLLETRWPWSDLTARPCLASAASERHFSPGSPEETPLHTMLFLPAAALCWLGSALAAMATQLVQDQLSLTRTTGQSVSFSCGGTDQCRYGWPVVWYQKNETETYRAILYIDIGDSPEKPYNHPQQDDFSAERNENSCKLKINKVKLDHSASYYCSCYSDSHRFSYLFGSGTKLHVTDDPVVKPRVSVYPAASSAQRGPRAFLLCLASDMFPPEVQFSWKRLEDGTEKDLTSAEQLELREPNRTASLLLVDRDPVSTSRYRCSVQHEGGPVEAPATQELPAAASCPPQTADQDLQQHDLSFQSQCRVKLLCLLYSLLIVKSLVYCCGLPLLMALRNKGPAPR
ncbi:immunoglobulin lambda-1 light chain-like [Gambusia affinis]|uniref:immunoglobulin lambda-1 light chain-like n=1 Tax=Gambusia affinis TaxID=33528 RepID=UPI001CDD7E47|nr:immunoglobulin lambda-1 light chain-like [Gambusia affinis]